MVLPILKQTWIVSGVLSNIIGLGMVLAFPASLLPGVMAKTSDIPVDLNTASWLASIIGFATIPGYFLSSFLMQWKGRRFAHAVMVIPGILGWIMLYFSTSVPMLFIGEFIGGITAGATVALGAVIIGEYTSPSTRGIFLNLKTTALCIGITIQHVLGHYLHWRTIALCSMVPLLVAFINICTWPESPAYLISKKHFKESRDIFFWLRGDGADVVQEYEDLLSGQKEKMLNSKDNESFKDIVIAFFKKFTERDFLKPVLIIFFAFWLLEACGRHSYPAYAPKIIGSINGGDKMQSFKFTLFIDIITTTSTSISCVLVKIMKRRTLLFFSGLISLLILSSISLYLYLATIGIIPNDKQYIPLYMLVGYFIVSNFGCTPIPMALLGEVFPLRHRAAGSAVSGLVMSVSLISALKMTPIMLENIKVHGTFAVLSVTMAISLVYLYFTLPETKDKTLQEIEDYFNYGTFLDHHKDNKETKVKMLKEKA